MSAVHGPRSELIQAHSPVRRRRMGLAYVEGIRTVELALRGAWQCERLFIEETLAATDEGGRVVTLANRRKVPVAVASSGALDRLTACETAPPIGVLLRTPEPPPADAPLPDRLLVLDRIQDPGNAGTLVRCARAFGFSVALTEGGVALTNEKMLRSTAGTAFGRGALFDGGSAAALASRLRAQGHGVYTLDPRGMRSVDEAARGTGTRVALVLGSEVAGIDTEAWRGAESLRIPMQAEVESLNVAMTGAIALFLFAREVGE